MVLARRLLPVAVPAALLVIAPAPATAAERTAQFAGRALLDGDTLVFEDRTFPFTENTGRSDFVTVSLQPDGRFHIDGGRAEPFLSTGQYTAGPGCDVTTPDQVAQWTCGTAGITRFEVRNPSNAGLITSLTLNTAFLPLPVTASLGPADDTFTTRPDQLESVDGG